VLHVRYTCREAGHLKADAVSHVKENVLQAVDSQVQLFSLNYDFAEAWHGFVSAATDGTRVLNISLDKNHFPYWAKVLGMEDGLTATFCCIDWPKKRLALASKTLALTGDAESGWTLSVTNANAEVFAFLKKNRENKVYMSISYSGLA
jgi:hypothetical protein